MKRSGSRASRARARLYGIPVVTPADPNRHEIVERVRAAAPDLLFSFYYRRMLGAELLALPRLGAYNLHGSLLPKYRGRAPVNWAILHGERETGATLHEMVAKPDAGRIVDRERVPILPNDTAREVLGKVAVAGRSCSSARCRRSPRAPRRSCRRTSRPAATSAGAVPRTARSTPPGLRSGFTTSCARWRHRIRARSSTCAGARLRLLRTFDCGLPPGPPHQPALVAGIARLELRRGRRRAARRARSGARRRARSTPRVSARPSGRSSLLNPRLVTKRILILGVNGFIGHHLSKRITRRHPVGGVRDGHGDRPRRRRDRPRRFHFFEGDITINREWIEYHVRKCDTVLPLVAIATPATYVKEPLRVFELDFEANLPIVRSCVKHRKRLIFPSTSEVYGMCRDREFDPETSELVLGPDRASRAGSTPARSS